LKHGPNAINHFNQVCARTFFWLNFFEARKKIYEIIWSKAEPLQPMARPEVGPKVSIPSNCNTTSHLTPSEEAGCPWLLRRENGQKSE
jgi:hypothetical protein